MLTITKLARSCGLSRSTVLYYESIGLLKPAPRTAGNYRRYSDEDATRLRQICIYREAGLNLADIGLILGCANGDAAGVLKRRLAELSEEIEQLRAHQRAILKLLRTGSSLWRTEVITKEKWVSIMQASGFTSDDMRRWHAEFEKLAPQEHQEFLEFLHLPPEEILAIREGSVKQAKQ